MKLEFAMPLTYKCFEPAKFKMKSPGFSAGEN